MSGENVMKAMQLKRLVSLEEEDRPLELVELPTPDPKPGEVRIAVVPVSLGFADREGLVHRQRSKKSFQIERILSGRVDAYG